MLGLKLNHVSKRGYWWHIHVNDLVNYITTASGNGLPHVQCQYLTHTIYYQLEFFVVTRIPDPHKSPTTDRYVRNT